MSENKNEVIEFVKLAEILREKNRDLFLETKGYLRGLVQKDTLPTKKIAQ